MLFFLQVLVPKDVDLMGKVVEVEIIETGKHFMKSNLVETAAIIEPGLSKPLEKGEVSGKLKQQQQQHTENKVSYQISRSF